MSNGRDRAEERAENQGKYEVPNVRLTDEQAEEASVALAKVSAKIEHGTNAMDLAADLMTVLRDILEKR